MKRRKFLKNTLSSSIVLTGLSSVSGFWASCKKEGPKLKDNFWLWGQNAGSHHEGSPEAGYRLPGKNLLGPREGADFFGLDKMLRVTMKAGPFPPFDDEAEKIKDLKEVVWSAIGAGGAKQYSEGDHSDIDEVIRMAEIYPNVTGAIVDDFFRSSEIPGVSVARHSVESILNMREKLHNFHKRRLDLWLVWYTYQLDFKVDDYLDLFDVITLWTWKGSDLPNLDENIKKCLNKTPGKRHFAGCYLWNYGERMPLTMDQMKYQLDRYYYWMKKGDIEGIIFCSNATVPDTGLDTADYLKKWIAETGEERI